MSLLTRSYQALNGRLEGDHVLWVCGKEVRRPAVLDASVIAQLQTCVPDGVKVRYRRRIHDSSHYEYSLPLGKQ